MKQILRNYNVLFLVILPVILFGQNPDKGFSSWLPAPNDDDALLIGNGEMGAMVFGYPHDETIIMNHYELYLPLSEPVLPINQADRLDEIKQLILNGKGYDAAKIPVEMSIDEGYNGQVWSNPYIPAFDIKISTSPGNVRDYSRSLNFENGEAVISWKQDEKQFLRKQFMSRADSCLVIFLTADTLFDATISFSGRPVAWNEWGYINDNFKNTQNNIYKGDLLYHTEFVHQWDGSLAGFDGIGKMLACNGKVTDNNNSITVSDASYVLFTVRIETYHKNETPPRDRIISELDILYKEYNRLLDSHSKIHEEVFNRVDFALYGNSKGHLDSETMNQKAKDSVTPETIVNKFYASRYNIYSATGKTPPNLQGIWGSSYQPPWSSDYTHDGNLPTAVSSFMCSDMPELMMSYFDYHDERIDDYRENAEKLYGCRGIQVPSHSSTQGYNVHFDSIWCLTFWNGGAAWASHFYYDYWLYTKDSAFLIDRAYPFMKEAALFYEDFLTTGSDGKFVFNPSYSPENHPLNHKSQATVNATMDIMLARELFTNLIKAGKTIGESKKTLESWEQIIKKLPDVEVNSDGYVREWIWPGYEENYNHRHVSQLYSYYDPTDFSFLNDPKLVEGIKNVVNQKMEMRRNEGGGIMVFGLVQLAWIAANIGDEQLTEEILNMLSSAYWSDSQATYHDPDGLFNMDLSGGYQAAVIKTLINSDEETLYLMPAKPKSWNSGHIDGVKTRNQLSINELVWDSIGMKVTVTSPVEQKINISYPDCYYNPQIVENNSTRTVIKVKDSEGFAVKLMPDQEISILFKKNSQ